MENHDLNSTLESLANELIAAAVREFEGVREGTVMTVGPAPYRRLDADGRALAYVRVRPRKRAVRIDISGLWRASPPSPLRCSSAGGSATLLVHGRGDLVEALQFLGRVLEETREAYAPAYRGLLRAA